VRSPPVESLRPTSLAAPRDDRVAREERANAITHGLGLVGGLVASAALAARVAGSGADGPLVVACAAYAVALVALMAASTLSHVAADPRRRHAWRVADQALIFLYMAAAWSPVALAHLREGAWWALHGALWAGALAGFASKLLGHRVQLGAVTTWSYVGVGALPLVTIWPLVQALPGGLVACLGGVWACNAAGLVFFHLDQRVWYFHAIWHVLVLGACACHFVGVLLYCTGGPAGVR